MRAAAVQKSFSLKPTLRSGVPTSGINLDSGLKMERNLPAISDFPLLQVVSFYFVVLWIAYVVETYKRFDFVCVQCSHLQT